MNNFIKNKLLTQKAKVGIVGLGYVGLPLLIKTSNKFKTI